MTIYTNLTIILPAAAQALAQGLCAAAAGEAGAGMFTTGLSATGTGEATHYISSGAIEDTFADMLPIQDISMDGETEVVAITSGNVEAILEMAQGTVSEAAIRDLFTKLDVSRQDPFTAMSRLGLLVVTETEFD